MGVYAWMQMAEEPWTFFPPTPPSQGMHETEERSDTSAF